MAFMRSKSYRPARVTTARVTTALMAGSLALAGLSAPGVLAQQPVVPPPAEVDLGPIARPVTIYVGDRPQVTVSFLGDHGLVRITGTLTGAPSEALKLTEPGTGRARDAAWNEVRILNAQQFPAEGFPLGSFSANLLTDAVPASGITSVSSSGGYVSRALDSGRGSWRLAELPTGDLTLTGAPYGTLKVPIPRLLSFQADPIRASVTELPKGIIQLQVLNGVNVSLPLADVQLYQRDLRNNTAVVTLADEQTFTGKVVQLPKVSVALTDQNSRSTASLPLERIALLERVPPAGRRF